MRQHCALDMSKAFDKVSHYALLKINEKENSQRIVAFANFMVFRMLLLCEMGCSAV